MAQETKVKTAKDHTKIGAVIILVISAIVFIPFGGYEVINALFGKRDVPVFGSYKGRKITYEKGSAFTNVTETLAERYKSYGIQVDSNSYHYLFSQAFSETVKDMAYRDAIAKTGYKAPDSAVNRMLVNYFMDENGNYSPKLYNQTSKATRKSLRESVEKTLEYDRFHDDLLGSNSLYVKDNFLYGVKIGSRERDFFTSLASEKHSFKYVAFNTANFPEEEAVKWARQDNNKDKFIKYDLSAISLDDEGEAKNLLKQLNSNEITFQDAVSEKSVKYFTDSEGKMSRTYRYQMALIVEDAGDLEKVLGLANGAVSDVVKTSNGFTIFRKDGADRAVDLSDSETVGVVQAYVMSNESGYVEDYYSSIARDFTAQALKSSFEEAAGNFNVSVVETEPFPLNYGSSSVFASVPSDNKEIKSLSTNDEGLKKVFALKEGETSTPVILGSNVIVFRCTGITNDSSDLSDTAIASRLENANISCAEQTLLRSPDVKNDVWNAYFDYFTEYGRGSK